MLAILIYLLARFIWRSGCGDVQHQIFGNQMLGFLNLLLGRRPSQDGLNLAHHLLGDTRGFGDMWLLSQILGEQFARGINRPIMIMIH